MGIVIDRIEQTLKDIEKLKSRNQRPTVCHTQHEAVSERDFVRKFGTKVASVRYSGRADMVGLIVAGRESGIWITRDKNGQRWCRCIDVKNGQMHVTERKLMLRDRDSLTFLWRGLLNWIK